MGDRNERAIDLAARRIYCATVACQFDVPAWDDLPAETRDHLIACWLWREGVGCW